MRPPPRPYAGAMTSYTTALLYQPSLYRKSRRLTRAVLRDCVWNYAVWDYYILRRFCFASAGRLWGRANPAPKGGAAEPEGKS